MCRAETEISRELKQKIALYCNVAEDDVMSVPDVGDIYSLPMVLHEEGADTRILEKLGIWAASENLQPWKDVVMRRKRPMDTVKIAIVGKYVHLTDTYKA